VCRKVQRTMFFASACAVAAVLLAAALLGAAPAAPADGARASTAAGLSGTWVATGPFGRIVLRLRRVSKVYRGTYTQVRRGKATGTSSRVVARADNADGVQQVTLTFVSAGRSDICGLRGAHLYCQVGAAGTAVFARV